MDNRIGLYLCFATIATWTAMVLGTGIILQDDSLFWESMAWQAAILLLLVLSTLPASQRKIETGRLAMWLLSPFIFALAWRVKIDFLFIYTIIWLACSPTYFSIKQSWALLVVINLVWYLMRLLVFEQSQPLVQTLLVATFHMFALLSSMAARAAEQANEKTQKLNRELLVTQHLLGEISRESERTRIARDLHDLLGHHLTALTINLQVAGHLTEGEAKEQVDQCHALSKLLLSDVREAVSTLREMPVVDLRELLEIAIREIPRLAISLHMEGDLQLDDVNTARALLRCVQEAITNSLKHTTASHATILVTETASAVELVYEDDGGGCVEYSAGNGLKGMRERILRLGGQLEVEAKPNMRLAISIPSAS